MVHEETAVAEARVERSDIRWNSVRRIGERRQLGVTERRTIATSAGETSGAGQFAIRLTNVRGVGTACCVGSPNT
ncbi:hypothetical protein GCM10018965_004110 [Nonomuraea roseola]